MCVLFVCVCVLCVCVCVFHIAPGREIFLGGNQISEIGAGVLPSGLT